MNHVKLVIIGLSILLLTSCLNKRETTLPIDNYWKTINDSLKFTSADTLSQFKIFNNHFSSHKETECLLERRFKNKDREFDVACIFKLDKNNWKLEKFICSSSIQVIDIDKDSLSELFVFDDLYGSGSIERNYKLISYKKEKEKENILFEDSNNSDNLNNIASYSISKIGDTIYVWNKYSFVDTLKSEPLLLKSIKKIGTKNGITKDKKNLIINYNSSLIMYKFDGNKYK